MLLTAEGSFPVVDCCCPVRLLNDHLPWWSGCSGFSWILVCGSCSTTRLVNTRVRRGNDSRVPVMAWSVIIVAMKEMSLFEKNSTG